MLQLRHEAQGGMHSSPQGLAFPLGFLLSPMVLSILSLPQQPSKHNMRIYEVTPSYAQP